jgi:short-subunit dehydrogenase
MDNSLTRPLAVVTGASNGIGYELAKQFAQNGFDLLITATGPSINEAAQAFEELGAHVETVQVDLATYDGVETLYNQIKATGRPVVQSQSTRVLVSAATSPARLT